jgi:uncharacterized protein YybS (DUF2232 family)
VLVAGFYALFSGGVAFSLHEAHGIQKFSGPKAGMRASVIATVAIAVLFSLGAIIAGDDPVAVTLASAGEAIDLYIDASVQQALNLGAVAAIQERRDDFVLLFAMITPSLLFYVLYAAVFATIAVAHYTASRLGEKVSLDGPPLSRWETPDQLVWGFLGGIILSLLTGDGPLFALGVNLAFICGGFFLVQGVGVLIHALLRLGASPIMQALGLSLAFSHPFTLMSVAIAGIADIWVDFRGIRQVASDHSDKDISSEE